MTKFAFHASIIATGATNLMIFAKKINIYSTPCFGRQSTSLRKVRSKWVDHLIEPERSYKSTSNHLRVGRQPTSHQQVGRTLNCSWLHFQFMVAPIGKVTAEYMQYMQYMCIYVVSNICTVISISNKISISCHRVLSLYLQQPKSHHNIIQGSKVKASA